MGEPFETVAFLANSENRVRLLNAIAENPKTRADLHEETSIPRATLGRILSDLEARGWIRQDGTHYEATPESTHLVKAFDTLVDTVAALDELQDLVQWVPTEEVGFDLGRLRDAHITRPNPADSIAPVRRAMTILQEADELLGLTSMFAPDALRANHNAVRNHGQQIEVVFTPTVIDIVTAEAETRRLMRELLAAGSVTAYQYNDELAYPYNIWIIDGEAVIGISDDEGAPRAVIETDDSKIREWVRATIDAHREHATALTAEDMSN
jgi:predicted transcriptional regulator